MMQLQRFTREKVSMLKKIRYIFGVKYTFLFVKVNDYLNYFLRGITFWQNGRAAIL